ncbi:ParB/RepB/Spo0J family partition protein [Clostridioides difficile]|uniref:ParB/RepB/Spo0J family partition protein n=1 Tax=Clostridioides difficile TaxID=1496 RepID=UPI00097FEBCD|nr:ParB/RepB/Spo0J family partition protein [Clostridioides difficile]SJP04980.1 Probable chromosome-partitioning protein parB [Clostridioides difficile]
MADDKTTKTPEQPVTDTGPGKEKPPEPEKIIIPPEADKKPEQEEKNPHVSVYDFAEIMKGKKAEERAAVPGVEKPAPEKTEKPEKQPEAPKKAEEKQEKPKEPEQPKRRGRPPKEDKDKAAAPKPKAPVQKKQEKAPKEKPEKKAAPTVQAAPAPKEPEGPKEAPRRGEEQIVYIKLNELHAFKNHPFEVRDDEEMRAMVSSVKDKGVTQPAIVRPREDGGYEIVSGHRRQKASELAGYADMPCIVRNLTDDEAITQMVEDNLNQREEILPSERAKALKMQLEAIKHQGAKTSSQIDPKDAGKRSNEIVAERNKMAVKQVQRYIRLNELVPDLMALMDTKKLGFTTAVELSYISKKNQNYIAVAIDSQQSSPSQAQAKRMRELDEKKLLNGDVIDGIMMEDKKEVDKVILTGAELSKYFGKETTPREMKDQIIKLLDDWKGQQKEHEKPEKKTEKEK